MRSGSVTAFSQGLSIVIHFASTVVLARLLTPEEFGVVSMVLAITLFARLFRDLGLSSSTVQRRQLTHEQLSTLYWINVAAGAVLTAVVAAAAPLVAWFYGRPELIPVTVCLAFTFLIGSFSTQQGALLVRQMRFERASIAHLSGALATFLIAAGLAWRGYSYWSLVIGTLSGALLTTLLLNAFSGWHPGRPHRGSGVRSMLHYGRNIVGHDVVNYFSRNLDNILVGKFAGAEALGLYSRAYQLLMFPITTLRGPINSVAFPALSRLQDRPEDFRSYYRTTVSLLAMASMPLVAFLFISSEPLILFMLGEQWLPVAGLFSLLAVAAFVQTASTFRGTVLMSLGLGQRYFRQAIINALVVCTGFIIGVRWGASGVALSYAITVPLMTYPLHAHAFRGTPLRTRDFFGSIAAPAVASVIAAAATWVLRQEVWPGRASWLDLGLSLLAFAPIYLLLLCASREARERIGRGWRLLHEEGWQRLRPARPAGVAPVPPAQPLNSASTSR